MFEPLSDVIRLRRVQRNLTQDRLAKMAGVSRRQLSLLEDGRNVSLLFLTKIARALEITELPIGDLRLRESQPELVTIVRANDVLQRVKQTLDLWAGAAKEIEDATVSLDELIDRALASGASARDIIEAAERLANVPDEERKAVGKTLRKLAQSRPSVRASRAKSAAGSTARSRRG
ncbi:MAG: helix-turn-helix domain-containing protein [Thermoanaerobaculia bacterium]